MRFKQVPLFVLIALMMVSCGPVVLTPPAIRPQLDTPDFTPAASQIVEIIPTETAESAPTDTPQPTLTPTEIIIPTIATTPTNTPCAWNWAYGDTTDLDMQLQAILDEAKIVGTIKTSSYGETGGDDCSYHEMETTAVITVYVIDTTDLPALTDLADRIETILQSTASKYGHKASLSNSRSFLLFRVPTGSSGTDCTWRAESKICQ